MSWRDAILGIPALIVLLDDDDGAKEWDEVNATLNGTTEWGLQSGRSRCFQRDSQSVSHSLTKGWSLGNSLPRFLLNTYSPVYDVTCWKHQEDTAVKLCAVETLKCLCRHI